MPKISKKEKGRSSNEEAKAIGAYWCKFWCKSPAKTQNEEKALKGLYGFFHGWHWTAKLLKENRRRLGSALFTFRPM